MGFDLVTASSSLSTRHPTRAIIVPTALRQGDSYETLLSTLGIRSVRRINIFRVQSRGNGPYVQSMDGPSAFYARCIPDQGEGNKGTTTIYRVRKETDEKIDTYNWYSPEGVVMGWSPIAGKVAVMSLREQAPTREQQIEFRFSLGGTLIHSYTTKDLETMGIKVGQSWDGERAQFKVLGCIQVPNTNNYDFVIQTSDGVTLAFDILTGKLRR
jgi:hypothetical protein